MHHQLHIHTPATIYIYMHKQASWQFTYSFDSFTSWKCKWTSAYATCLREKNLDCLCGCLRTPTRTVKYQVNSLRSCIRSSLEYMRLVIQKETLLTWPNILSDQFVFECWWISPPTMVYFTSGIGVELVSTYSLQLPSDHSSGYSYSHVLVYHGPLS